MVGGVFTYPEEEDCVAVEEGVAGVEVRTTTTDEEESWVGALAPLSEVMGVEDEVGCDWATATDVDEADEVYIIAEVDAAEEEGVLWGSIRW